MKNAIRLVTVLVGVGLLVTMLGCPKKQVVAPEPIVEPEPEPVVKPEPVRINLTTIYFDFDRSDIRSGDARTLEANARIVNEARVKPQVMVEGHCDPMGTAEYNMALGMRRAESAKSFLVKLGVPATQLMTISYGEEKLVTNDETQYQLNRRAEFKVELPK